MEDLRQFFNYLNDVNFEYVVLRNWEGLPYSVELGQHSDLDLLVYDYSHFFEVIGEAKPEFDLPRVRTKLPIDDTYIFMDVRYVGDNYYPEDFQRAILDSREWNSRGFFTPNPLHHRIALAYHAVHHKGHIAPEYKKYLGDATMDQLLSALKGSNVGWVKPDDHTVGDYNGYFKGATSIVSKEDGKVTKRQTAYSSYPLIKNEVLILESLKGMKHFPQIIASCTTGEEGHILTTDDCGDPISIDNLPKDWKEQCKQILSDLKDKGIEHRDIRPDNLLVKDNTIKLIDFGWATGPTGEHLGDPPKCLGFGYKCTEGFSDAFSMNKVIRELDYAMEEICES